MRRFSVLDSFRGICALLVALMHFETLTSFYFLDFTRHSFLFVDFFFVLSGFVITHAYFEGTTNPKSVGNFVIKRIGRLWPLHVAVFFILVAVQFLGLLMAKRFHVEFLKAPFTGNWDVGTMLPNLLLMHSFGLTNHNSWNAPSWSISAELWTYLIFAAVCLWARTRIILVSALTSAAALTVLMIWSPNFINTQYDFGLARCVAGFFVGVILRRTWKAVDFRFATLLEIGALAVVIAYVVLVNDSRANLLAPFVFAIPIWVFAHEAGALSAFLRQRPVQALGDWSYSIYMTHFLYAAVIFRNGPAVVSKLFHVPNMMVNVTYMGDHRVLFYPGNMVIADGVALLYVTLILVTAAFSFRFIEMPAKGLFYRIADRVAPRARRPVVAVASAEFTPS